MRKIFFPLALTLVIQFSQTLELQAKSTSNGCLNNTNTLSNSATAPTEKVEAAPEIEVTKNAPTKPANPKQPLELKPALKDDIYPAITKRALDTIYEALQVAF